MKTNVRLSYLLSCLEHGIYKRRKSMLGNLSADIICSEKRTVLKIGEFINNSRHLARKHARIFVRGHNLFREEEQIMSKNKYRAYFRPKLYYPSNLSSNARNFENWGIFNNYSPKWRWIVAIKLCDFKTNLMKWQLSLGSSNFDLKLYAWLWFQIDFEITLMISDQIALHTVHLLVLPLWIGRHEVLLSINRKYHNFWEKEKVKLRKKGKIRIKILTKEA